MVIADRANGLARNRARWRFGSDPRNVVLTPAYVLEPIRAALGGVIGLDPCTEPDNPTGAERWYALPTNGLAEPWDAESVYCNPPYGAARVPWIRRCIELGQTGRYRVALLIPAETDTPIVQGVLAGADAVTLIHGRLVWGGSRPNGRAVAQGRGSMVATWGADVDPLAELGVTMRACSGPSLGSAVGPDTSHIRSLPPRAEGGRG